MDHYFDVFFEALWTASVVPFSTDATYAAMNAFGGFDMRVPFALAVTGASIGQVFNIVVGKFLLTLHQKGQLHVSEKWYGRISQNFNKYGIFLLLFSWVSFLKVLVVVAGFVGTRIRFALPLIIIGQIYHYGSYLM